MIRRHERRAAIGLPVAAQFCDAERFSKQTFDGGRAESDENFRADQINLLVQIRNARFHFLRSWLAISGGLAGRVGPAFQNVGDVNVRARKSGGLDDFREQLSGATDERFALFVFIRARRFADEHQLRVNAPDAEYNIFARRCEVRAFHANQSAFAQRGKRGGFFFWVERRGGGRIYFRQGGRMFGWFGIFWRRRNF